MKKRIRQLSLIAAIAFGVFFTDNVLAQPGGGGGPGGGDDADCWPPPCIPIDGGVGWLLAAGALYGGRKAYKFSREEEQDEA